MGEGKTLKDAFFSIFEKFDDFTSSFNSFVPFIFIGFGLFLLAAYFFRFFYVRFGPKHHSVVAKILISEVEEKFQRGGKATWMYTPIIEYEYLINGMKYQSRDLFIHGGTFSSSNKNEAINFQKKFAVGAEVTAYVNSLSPEKSYLEAKSPADGFMLFTGIAFTATPIIILYFF